MNLETFLIDRAELVLRKVIIHFVIDKLLNVVMLTDEDLQLVSCEAVQLRDQEVTFAELSLELYPLFEVLMQVEYSNGSVAAKEHDNVMVFFVLLLCVMVVAIHVNVLHLT